MNVRTNNTSFSWHYAVRDTVKNKLFPFIKKRKTDVNLDDQWHAFFNIDLFLIKCLVFLLNILELQVTQKIPVLLTF